jgi:hypothetical protein
MLLNYHLMALNGCHQAPTEHDTVEADDYVNCCGLTILSSSSHGQSLNTRKEEKKIGKCPKFLSPA